MIFDLIRGKYHFVTSSYCFDLPYYFGVLEKTSLFNVHINPEWKRDEWIKFNAIFKTKLKKIWIDYEKVFDNLEIQISLDNSSWDTIWSGDLIPENGIEFDDVKFIFLKFNFRGIFDKLTIQDIQIYIEEEVEKTDYFLSHYYYRLIPSFFIDYKPDFSKFLQKSLEMWEKNYLDKFELFCNNEKVNKIQTEAVSIFHKPLLLFLEWNSEPVQTNSSLKIHVQDISSTNVKAFLRFNHPNVAIYRINNLEFNIIFPKPNRKYPFKVFLFNDFGSSSEFDFEVEVGS